MADGDSVGEDSAVFSLTFVIPTQADSEKHIVMIVAPPEPTVLHIEKIEHYFAKKLNTIRFSSKNTYSEENVIIIDSIGILLTLYYYADIAYVGGSFKQGIHNVLEPAVYGIPVIFGPKIDYSLEAQELVKRGASEVVTTKQEASKVLIDLFSNDEKRKEVGNKASQYVNENIGASVKIFTEIEKYL